jgi:hypothetical protein
MLFGLQTVVPGLTVGTAYWYDACVAAITANTATLGNVSIRAAGL